MFQDLQKINFVSEVSEIALPKQPKNITVLRFAYQVKSDIVIGYLLYPKTSSTSLPCVIRLRGGSGDFGMLSPKSLAARYVPIAAAGYVVITTQYRGVEGGTGVDDFGGLNTQADVEKLKKILNKLPRADTKRIGLIGHSRGGLMVYQLLKKVRWVKAAVIGGAPVDEISAAKERKGWREHQIKMYGKSKQAQIDRSAIYWVDALAQKTPILLVHGACDWRVNASHSLRMSQAMLTHKIPHRLLLVEGADHQLSNYNEEYMNETLSWLDRFLVNNEPIPTTKPHGR